MPAGLPYFAWIDAGETTFTSGHMRWDEQVFSFKLSQEEGDPASLTAVVRRPKNVTGDAIGLLGPGRKIWCWFALDCGPSLIKFRGRLVGIPTSILEELVTLEFVAKPIDLVAQKEALAASLRVLPFYDEAVIDPARANDPDVVLEGYTKVWHYDRESHIITVSDEILGEDGTVNLDGVSEDGKVLYDGLGLTLTSGPLARVDMSAEYTWTQQAQGTVDLTSYLISHWPGAGGGVISSYSLYASDWPKPGAGIGDGWVVADATATDLNDFTTSTITSGSTSIVKYPDGDGHTTSFTDTRTVMSGSAGVGAIQVGIPVVTDDIKVTYAHDGDGRTYTASYSRNYSDLQTIIPLQYVKVTLVAGYTAKRQCTERVAFTLVADVQPILTDPEDGEALRIDDVRSLNLTENGLIGDARRRSYIATERGNQSLEHLIALARAHLMKRARTVEVTCAPKLSRMPEIALRKNLFLVEPRINEALGKIIGYSIALDGSDGRINCEVRIGCVIGRGGTVATTDGTPTYCTIDYAGADYQQFVGRTALVASFGDLSVGYQPPRAAPNDDGINFMGSLRAGDVIAQGLVVTNGPLAQAAGLSGNLIRPAVQSGGGGNPNDASSAHSSYVSAILKNLETNATFKLKPMTGEFTTNYDIQLTDLKIPTGYNLEAV